MRRRDKRRKRDRRRAREKDSRIDAPKNPPPGSTLKVTRDHRGKQYIVAPDGSLRRGDRVNPDKFCWLVETEGKDVR